MIGTRAAVSAVLALGLTLASFGGRTADPAADLAGRRLVEERAGAVVAALDRLGTSLRPGIDAARHGSAQVVAGDEDPGPQLTRAADLLRDAEPAAGEVLRAASALDGALRARRPGEGAFESGLAPGEIGSIASQLEASADGADAFATMRRRAEGLIGTLEEALRALEAGDLDAAGALADEARTDHDALTAWENALLTLPVWIETTDAMIGDVEEIVRATRRGDGAAAGAAAAAFAGRADEGATADRALRIAMSEGGASVMAPVLGRLAGVLDTIARMRAEAAAIAEAAAR
jgi:hypothetical protein